MSTAAIADPTLNGAGSYTVKGPMRSVLTDRAAARRHLDTLLSTPRAGVEFVAAQIRAGMSSRFARALAGKARWLLGVLGTAGPGNLTVLAVTTHQGRQAIRMGLSWVSWLVRLPFRVAFTPVGWLLRHTGAPGRKVETGLIVGYSFTRDKISNAVQTVDCWLADRHDTPGMQAVRSWVTLSIVRRLISRFVPSGWWRLAAYAAAVVVVPDPGFEALADRVDAATKRITAAAKPADGSESVSDSPVVPPVSSPAEGPESPAAAAQAAFANAPDGTVTRLDKKSIWSINGYGPAADPIVLSVERGGIRERVLAHRQHDGVVVYQFGKSLYVGRVPADVDHDKVAAAIVQAQDAVEGDMPVPANRGARRAQERAAKRS